MQLGFAFLADAALASPDGKIGILGGNFDTLYVRKELPVIHPTMTLVINLRVQPAECGRVHRLRVEFWDPDGTPVLEPMEVTFNPQRHGAFPHRPVSVNLITVLQGVEIPRLGDYAFHILVDDLQVGEVPFWVVPLAGPPPGTDLPPESAPGEPQPNNPSAT